MKKGYFSLVLHSHLPYVIGHGRWPHGMDWLNEAAAETYIPILEILNKFKRERIKPKFTIDISPVLCEQLADEAFKDEFNFYLNEKIKAAEENRNYFSGVKNYLFRDYAVSWGKHYQKILKEFESKYKGEVVNAFKVFQDEGYIEIITCCATHGYLPLLLYDENVQAQVKCGIDNYEKFFNKKPSGIWLPECAYRPRYEWRPPVEPYSKRKVKLRKGIEEILYDNDIKFFYVDSHILRGGRHIGVYLDRFKSLRILWKQFEKKFKARKGEYDNVPQEIYLVSSSGEKPVAVFTREPETALQVWSGDFGYPGDQYYLDFHKKHFPGGLRYWRVTHSQADLGLKQEYIPARAKESIINHSRHFVGIINRVLDNYKNKSGLDGIVTAPFDAELFGHWWFEGVDWLYNVVKNIVNETDIQLTTSSEYLKINYPEKIISIPEGSWGEGGFHYIWLNEWTNWTWTGLHAIMQKIDLRDIMRILINYLRFLKII
jgi:1,4-alpha-glucan branching enzyme